jgi:DNA-directed RNA polymerase specialized sigma24 family protein
MQRVRVRSCHRGCDRAKGEFPSLWRIDRLWANGFTNSGYRGMNRPTLALPSFAGVSDEELMEGLKNRNEIALHEFRVRFGRVLRTIVDDTLLEENEADDAVQDTFLQIWKRAHYYSRQCGRPLGWIITVARRRAIDRLRRRLSYSRAMENFKAHAAETIDRGTDSSVEEKLVSSDLRRFLQASLTVSPSNSGRRWNCPFSTV